MELINISQAESNKLNQPAVASPQRPLLRQQVSSLLDRAELESDSFERWHLYQRIRELCRDLRPVKGYAIFWEISVVAFCCILLMVAISYPARHAHYYSYSSGDYLRVIENLDPCLPDGSCGYRFVLQNVKDGVAADPTEMHFCTNGIQPRFESGHVLSWIRYAPVGSCFSIDGFDVVRDAQRLPVLAPNCKPDYTLAPKAGHIVCEGGRAKFE